jgi:hypothetical protein
MDFEGFCLKKETWGHDHQAFSCTQTEKNDFYIPSGSQTWLENAPAVSLIFPIQTSIDRGFRSRSCSDLKSRPCCAIPYVNTGRIV